jgi:hypothetical protein
LDTNLSFERRGTEMDMASRGSDQVPVGQRLQIVVQK